MNKVFKNLTFLVIISSLFLFPFSLFAQETTNTTNSLNPLSRLEKTASQEGPYAPANETTVSAIAGSVVNIFLGILGIIFIILIILAGYKWMIASGNEEQITKAKSQLKTAIIGLIIVLGSYVIWEFIFTKFIAKAQ